MDTAAWGASLWFRVPGAISEMRVGWSVLSESHPSRAEQAGGEQSRLAVSSPLQAGETGDASVPQRNGDWQKQRLVGCMGRQWFLLLIEEEERFTRCSVEKPNICGKLRKASEQTFNNVRPTILGRSYDVSIRPYPFIRQKIHSCSFLFFVFNFYLSVQKYVFLLPGIKSVPEFQTIFCKRRGLLYFERSSIINSYRNS